MFQSPNLMLNSLPQNVYAAIESHLHIVQLSQGEVLAQTDALVDRVYFPYLGIVSLVVEMKDGDTIETAMVGRDGVINGTSALDGKVSLHKGIVQAAGAAAAINPDALRSLAKEFDPLHGLLSRLSRDLSASQR